MRQVEQAQFAHLCTVMSSMHHRRCARACARVCTCACSRLLCALVRTRMRRCTSVCATRSWSSSRSSGYPFGTLVDFASDGAGFPIFCMSPLAIHTRSLSPHPPLRFPSNKYGSHQQHVCRRAHLLPAGSHAERRWAAATEVTRSHAAQTACWQLICEVTGASGSLARHWQVKSRGQWRAGRRASAGTSWRTRAARWWFRCPAGRGWPTRG